MVRLAPIMAIRPVALSKQIAQHYSYYGAKNHVKNDSSKRNAAFQYLSNISTYF
jgi:hypothetical protein